MSKYTAAPHPFVLSVPWKAPEEEAGQRVELTLFGYGNRYLAYLIQAMKNAGRKGLHGGPEMELARVEQEEDTGSGRWRTILDPLSGEIRALPARTPEVPALPEALEFEFLTPLRLRHSEAYVGGERFRFADLFGSLLRRISLLTSFHTDTPLETDFRGLMDSARSVEFLWRDLHWKDWTRYSSRQRKRMQMGGLLGLAALNGSQAAPFWPYLWLGQWTHAGKGTAMGLGAYRIRPGKLADSGPENAPGQN